MRASDPETPPAEPDGFVGARLLAPAYLGDITMPGGRDYVSGSPALGVGLRLDVAGRVVGGLTLGAALAFTYNPMEPQFTSDTRDALTSVLATFLVGYRGTIANVVVVGGALGVGLHETQPTGGGWGALAELEFGAKVSPSIVVGAGLSLEVLGGMSQASSPTVRLTPALIFELLL